MSRCASCGLSLFDDTALCPHHHAVHEDDWAISNRIMCDFVHRGVVPDRLPEELRADDFWVETGTPVNVVTVESVSGSA